METTPAEVVFRKDRSRAAELGYVENLPADVAWSRLVLQWLLLGFVTCGTALAWRPLSERRNISVRVWALGLFCLFTGGITLIVPLSGGSAGSVAGVALAFALGVRALFRVKKAAV